MCDRFYFLIASLEGEKVKPAVMADEALGNAVKGRWEIESATLRQGSG